METAWVSCQISKVSCEVGSKLSGDSYTSLTGYVGKPCIEILVLLLIVFKFIIYLGLQSLVVGYAKVFMSEAKLHGGG